MDKEEDSMARPKCDFNESDFLKYYSIGYNDSQIAGKMGVSRMTAARRRREMNLEARVQRGWRNMSLQGQEPYWRFANRVFARYPQIARRFRRKAEELLIQRRIDFATYYICMGTEPGPGPLKPIKDVWRKKLGLDRESLRRILEFEREIEYSGLAGVPGPALIELVQVMRTASEETMDKMIEQAVLEAGLVSIHACIGHPLQCCSVSSWTDFWGRIQTESEEWLNAGEA